MNKNTIPESSPPRQSRLTARGRGHANNTGRFISAAKLTRHVEAVVNELLADKNNWPSRLLQPSGVPWSHRGVSKAFALQVLRDVEKHYLAGYAKTGNDQYTGHLCKNGYRRVSGRPKGAEVSKKEQKPLRRGVRLLDGYRRVGVRTRYRQ